jgi:outer membrane biosynthesis protein TonB
MQELMLVSFQILASQGLKLMALRQATNSLLSQLRINTSEEAPQEPTRSAPPPPPPPPPSKPEPQPQQQPEPTPTYNQYPQEVEAQLDNIDSIFDDGIVTKE